MQKTAFGQFITSRTVWTIVFMLVFNLIPNLPLNQPLKDLINGIFGIVAVYFKLNPSQNYGTPQ